MLENSLSFEVLVHFSTWIFRSTPVINTVFLGAIFIEGSLEAKLPTIWTDEKQSREEAERRDSSEEKRSEERRCRCAKR